MKVFKINKNELYNNSNNNPPPPKKKKGQPQICTKRCYLLTINNKLELLLLHHKFNKKL